ncbi:hypothetical protein N7509_005529 [Penicillium cosmopolitanum]|uniref:Uncharacterized protein n=1 Tax=Penicillium cosmopolitanum TaxID=1131564 RepID=A0A9W9W2L9_9EURO|nr:uncharacterized protein N7509_005529 [Penicillium cosmopolitanum]KAJ5397416.1 hypothetical protein N7509_005529 [Penicillium cosmopolitanum]
MKKASLQRFRSLPKEPWDFDDFLEITGDDGWTDVTSGSNVRRAVRTTKARSDRETNRVDETELFLSPAEASAGLTFEELKAQYRGYNERWIQSETWQKPRVQLDQRIHDQETETSSQDLNVDGIVCIGLGSPGGFLRGVISFVYESIPKNDRGLRDLVVVTKNDGLIDLSTCSLVSLFRFVDSSLRRIIALFISDSPTSVILSP